MARKNTRNAQGGGTIRKRSDGRWEARFTVGRNPGTGRQVQKSVYGATQAEVRKKLLQAVSAVDEGTYTEPSRLTVSQWLDVWLKDYSGHLKPTTLNTYQIYIDRRIRPVLGAIKLAKLHPHTLQAFYNGLLQGDSPIKPKTIKNIHGVLHKVLSQAVELGYLPRNPADACKLPRVERHEIKPLADGNIPLFIKTIKGHQFEKLYIVDLFTGMRQSEIIGLTWDCVDFNKQVIHVQKQLQKIKSEYQFTPPKNNKPRVISPPDIVWTTLHEQKRQQAEWKLAAGQAWDNHMNLVFTNSLGRYLIRQTVYKNLKILFDNMGISELRFHDLRHSFAVVALSSGVDVKTVQESLGHHTAAFTLDVYGHVSERMKQDAVNKLNQFVDSVT